MPSAASGARRNAERRAALTFFLDHQIGRYVVAEALRAKGANVEVHVDHFAPDAPDVKWIPEVAHRGWVLITKDQNIRRNPVERAAYQSTRLRGFVVTAGSLSGKELAALLGRSLDGMVRRAHGRPGPFLFALSANGIFSRLI